MAARSSALSSACASQPAASAASTDATASDHVDSLNCDAFASNGARSSANTPSETERSRPRSLASVAGAGAAAAGAGWASDAGCASASASAATSADCRLDVSASDTTASRCCATNCSSSATLARSACKSYEAGGSRRAASSAGELQPMWGDGNSGRVARERTSTAARSVSSLSPSLANIIACRRVGAEGWRKLGRSALHAASAGSAARSIGAHREWTLR